MYPQKKRIFILAVIKLVSGIRAYVSQIDRSPRLTFFKKYQIPLFFILDVFTIEPLLKIQIKPTLTEIKNEIGFTLRY